jgi:hypothetical protein
MAHRVRLGQHPDRLRRRSGQLAGLPRPPRRRPAHRGADRARPRLAAHSGSRRRGPGHSRPPPGRGVRVLQVANLRRSHRAGQPGRDRRQTQTETTEGAEDRLAHPRPGHRAAPGRRRLHRAPKRCALRRSWLCCCCAGCASPNSSAPTSTSSATTAATGFCGSPSRATASTSSRCRRPRSSASTRTWPAARIWPVTGCLSCPAGPAPAADARCWSPSLARLDRAGCARARISSRRRSAARRAGPARPSGADTRSRDG